MPINTTIADSFRDKIKSLRDASSNLFETDIIETQKRVTRILDILDCNEDKKRVTSDVDAEVEAVKFSSDTPLLGPINSAIATIAGPLDAAGFKDINDLNSLAEGVAKIIAQLGITPLDLDISCVGPGTKRILVVQVATTVLEVKLSLTIAGTNVLGIEGKFQFPTDLAESKCLQIVDCTTGLLLQGTEAQQSGDGQAPAGAGNGSKTDGTAPGGASPGGSAQGGGNSSFDPLVTPGSAASCQPSDKMGGIALLPSSLKVVSKDLFDSTFRVHRSMNKI